VKAQAWRGLAFRPAVADGKAKKLALIAVMRKLIFLLNHLPKNPKFKLA
jgi:hypothetical protein